MIRNARLDDIPAIRDLINTHAEHGLMLFRSLANLYENVRDFKLYETEGVVIGCCALQIYWADLAEIKSLAVKPGHQGQGIGSQLVRAALTEAQELHLKKIFTLTLERHFFERLGFVKVPMDSLPMKVWSDCVRCSKQAQCDEIALMYKVDLQ